MGCSTRRGGTGLLVLPGAPQQRDCSEQEQHRCGGAGDEPPFAAGVSLYSSTIGVGGRRCNGWRAGCWSGGGRRCDSSQALRSSGFGEGAGEVHAAREAVGRILGQRGSQNWVERGEFGSCIREGRHRCGEVAANDDCGVEYGYSWDPVNR